jgi:DHA2 family multidrug resistance protein
MFAWKIAPPLPEREVPRPGARERAPAAMPERPAPLPRQALLVLVIALSGSLLTNVVGQFVGSSLVDIQGGIAASADEASWLVTVYSMGFICGIVFSSPILATFGMGRYSTGAALVFAGAALACAARPELPLMVALRALQGFAAGGFGPLAFAAVFTTMAGPRLPLGLSLLAFVLVLPTNLGPAVSGLIESRFGWQALFLLQAGVGAALAAAALLFMPRGPIGWPALRRDWTSLLLLSIALAASLLVLGQGTRRYWLDSAAISWSIAVAIGAWGGFAVGLWRSPQPILDVRLIVKRAFVLVIGLNFIFRAGFAFTAFLVPQFLVLVQGYRPLEIGRLFLLAAAAQLLTFPLVWWLLQRVERRLVLGSGLLLFGAGALLAADATPLWAGDQFRLAFILAALGQVAFLVPNLVAGGSSLQPADGPTASLMFNATTLGGTSVGVALATELVTERQKFHFGALAESATAFGQKLDPLDGLSDRFASRLGDDPMTAAQGLATLGRALQREAWVLSFSDAFLLAAALLLASALGALFLHRQPPLRGSPTS